MDYFTDMVDSAGFLKEDLADDGLHPNTSGYRTMAPLVLEAIDKAVTPEPQKKRRRFPF